MDYVEGVPVAEDLFRVDNAGAALVGSRCSGCGSHYFPRALSCRNPACDDKSVDEILMGRQGVLYSYTMQGYRPPALFQMEPWEPYGIGLVELPEGLRVMAMLTRVPLDEIRIGTPVRLVTEPLYRDELGRTVMTYKYAPNHRGRRTESAAS